ncbi:MAG: signal peptidase I [Candidatus Egerieousia sp.]
MIFFKNKWFKFSLWGTLYLLWVIWLGNYWWLLGLPVIFDLYITKKVRWAFWRSKKKRSKFADTLIEWIDAIIFAAVAAVFIKTFWFESFTIPSSSMEKTLLTGDYLFVTKLAYGPKIPETPLSFPLVHNTMPLTGGKSYSTLIKNKYRRLKGFSNVKNGDIVVFLFPNGDTVLTQSPQADYYQMVRLYNGDRNFVRKEMGPVIVHPKDKKDIYVKRCVAVAGDSLQIVDGTVYVNGVREPLRSELQSSYTVVTKGDPINSVILDEMELNLSEVNFDSRIPGYADIPLTASEAETIKKLPIVVSVTENIDVYPPDYPDSPAMLFPFTTDVEWTRDNYGPIWIPKKGATVRLTRDNLPFYERIITTYEGNTLEVKDGTVAINGKPVEEYTFKQDYFWMMGDNRHNSLDSRYWGFVPEDHVIGTPSLLWFSTDKTRGIRWKRLFKVVRHI